MTVYSRLALEFTYTSVIPRHTRTFTMRDFTRDSISLHVLSTATPVAFAMFAHMVYQVVDLYFVAKVSVAATAGVNAAGNAMFIVLSILQVLTVGTIAPIANAVGRRDREDANLVFNQSLMLSVVSGTALAVLFLLFLPAYMTSLTEDAATIEAGTDFMLWVLPGFALLLPMGILSCTLRAAGIVQASVVAYTLMVAVNAALAPVLIVGWGTGAPMGAKGAGLATSIAVAIGLIFLSACFRLSRPNVVITMKLMRPCFSQWYRVLRIGLPSGGESAITFLLNAVVYYAIRDLGPAAQAGYGIGSRLLQALLVPAMAIASAIGPIVGQNFGANQIERVRETFRQATLVGTALMLATTLAVQYSAPALVGIFTADSATSTVAVLFLQLVSLTLVPQCLVQTCSGVFQGLGNTMPSLIACGARLIVFSSLMLAVFSLPMFRIEYIWYVWIASITLQAMVSWHLLRVQFAKVLPCDSVSENGPVLVKQQVTHQASERPVPADTRH